MSWTITVKSSYYGMDTVRNFTVSSEYTIEKLLTVLDEALDMRFQPQGSYWERTKHPWYVNINPEYREIRALINNNASTKRGREGCNIMIDEMMKKLTDCIMASDLVDEA